MKLVKDTNIEKDQKKISDKEAEDAFKTILAWMGEDPNREGLLETPKRVVKAFKEYFKGYKEDPTQILDKTFGDVEGYDDMVVQKNISVQSHCEHHMAPIIGVVHIAYIPNKNQQFVSFMRKKDLLAGYKHWGNIELATSGVMRRLGRPELSDPSIQSMSFALKKCDISFRSCLNEMIVHTADWNAFDSFSD